MQILRSAVLAAAGLLLQQATAAPLTAMTTTVSRAVEERATRTVNEVTLFSPPSDAGWVDPRVLYARAVSLSSGALLATWENYSPEPPLVYFPIYRSTDGGATWAEIGRVQDTVNNWGLRYQPTLFELPQAFGRFPKGTVLAAGNSIPTDLSQTKIDVYASTDGGATWAFVSSVASGGEARPNNGLTPVWEPLFFVYDNQLVCYYSDQRDPQHGQKLVHQTTTDLLSWGPLVDDVAEADYEMRPGMPAVTRLPDGNYLFAYEMCGPGGGCRVHVRRAPSPLAMLNAPDYALRSDRGTYPVSSPNVVWSRVGGPDGAVVLSSGSGPIFVNRQLGDPAAWTEHATPAPGAYSRGLALLQDDDNALVIIGAGHLPPSSTNKVTVSVVDLAATIGA